MTAVISTPTPRDPPLRYDCFWVSGDNMSKRPWMELVEMVSQGSFPVRTGDFEFFFPFLFPFLFLSLEPTI